MSAGCGLVDFANVHGPFLPRTLLERRKNLALSCGL